MRLPASSAANLASCLHRLSVDEVGKALKMGASDANRISESLKKKLNDANAPFVAEAKRVYDENTRIADKYRKEMEEKEGALKEEELAKFGAKLSKAMKKEVDAVHATSKTKEMAQEEVAVDLSEAEREYLKMLLDASASFWQNQQTGESYREDFLRCADAIDHVEEAEAVA